MQYIMASFIGHWFIVRANQVFAICFQNSAVWLHCVVYSQCMPFSFSSSALSQSIHAAMHETELFLLPQHIHHREHGNRSNQGLTLLHQGCDSFLILPIWILSHSQNFESSFGLADFDYMLYVWLHIMYIIYALTHCKVWDLQPVLQLYYFVICCFLYA
jgi:hypothetical protein